MHFFKQIHTINVHRHYVGKLMRKCGIFWGSFFHDLSKYSPKELFESAKYYSGTKSPITNCINTNGYSLAFVHHKNKNKHHELYWYDPEFKVQPLIPYRYAVEAICDSVGASMVFSKNNFQPQNCLKFFEKQIEFKKLVLNPKIFEFQQKVFTDLANNGINFVFNKKYMKNTYNSICNN